MEYNCISVERIGSVERIRHNRPSAGNAQNTELLDELDHALRVAEADGDVRVVILASVGKHFSAGHDLKEASGWNRTVEERWEFEKRRYVDYCMRLRDLQKPTIAQVQGACIAAGFMVANMCDLLVASEDAYFADPVVHTISAAAVEMLVHPWVMSLRRAKEMLYTGRRITAQEAYDWGMVNRVAPREELDAATLELANQVAAAPPFAMKMTKRSLNRTEDIQGFRNAISAHFELHELTHVTEEYRALRERGIAGAIEAAKGSV